MPPFSRDALGAVDIWLRVARSGALRNSVIPTKFGIQKRRGIVAKANRHCYPPCIPPCISRGRVMQSAPSQKAIGFDSLVTIVIDE